MKKCKTCNGKGRWQVRQVVDGDEEVVWYECGGCNATGLDPNAKENVENFSIHGVDDDEE